MINILLCLLCNWFRAQARVEIKYTAQTGQLHLIHFYTQMFLYQYYTIWSYSIVTLNIIKIKFTASIDIR